MFEEIRRQYTKVGFKLYWVENVAIPLHQVCSFILAIYDHYVHNMAIPLYQVCSFILAIYDHYVHNMAIPLHQDHNVIDHHDWRTYHRWVNFLVIYMCNFHVLSILQLIYICKLHWNVNDVS